MAYAYDNYPEYDDYEDDYESYEDNGWRREPNYRGSYPTYEGYYEEYEEDSDGSEDYDESTEGDDEASDQDDDSVPEVCRRHSSRNGCPEDYCGRLHICRFFLAGNCKFDRDCRYGHSLTTMYNQEVCSDHGLSTKRSTLEMLMSDVDLGASAYHNQLEICFETGYPTSCDGSTCNRLHICRNYVTGTCRRRRSCKFGHDLYAGYNGEVLRRHMLGSKSEEDILGLLCDKYSGVAGDRQAAERPTTSGAVQRNGGASATRDGQCTAERSAQGARGAGATENRPATAAAGPKGATGSRQGASADVPVVGAVGGARPRDQHGPALTDELACPVCLELLQSATTLNCGHTLCACCVKAVREADAKCPMCRCRITSSVRSVMIDNIISRLRSSGDGRR